MSKEAIFWSTMLFFGLFICSAITWITFARLSMARIEQAMKKDGMPESFLWDGIGGRIFFYAFAIVFPEKLAKRIDRLIDVSLVRRYSNHGDWLRGVIFLATTYSWIVISFIGIYLDVYQ